MQVIYYTQKIAHSIIYYFNLYKIKKLYVLLIFLNDSQYYYTVRIYYNLWETWANLFD